MRSAKWAKLPELSRKREIPFVVCVFADEFVSSIATEADACGLDFRSLVAKYTRYTHLPIDVRQQIFSELQFVFDEYYS
jgi:hypothetical protein